LLLTSNSVNWLWLQDKLSKFINSNFCKKYTCPSIRILFLKSNLYNKSGTQESLDDIYFKCAMDYNLYGLAYIEIIWGKGYKNISEIYHIDASKIRWGKINDKGRAIIL